jgi:hypothetical protein
LLADARTCPHPQGSRGRLLVCRSPSSDMNLIVPGVVIVGMMIRYSCRRPVNWQNSETAEAETRSTVLRSLSMSAERETYEYGTSGIP